MDLQPTIEKRLRELAEMIRLPQIASRARAILLKHSDIEIPSDRELLPKIVPIWAEERGVSGEQAVIDIALEAELIDHVEYAALLQALGESASTASTNPEWKPETEELLLGGKVIRKVRVRENRSHVQVILDAFQKEGWARSIPNPLPRTLQQQDRHKVLNNLNKGLQRIRFHAQEGATLIYWKFLEEV